MSKITDKQVVLIKATVSSKAKQLGINPIDAQNEVKKLAAQLHDYDDIKMSIKEVDVELYDALIEGIDGVLKTIHKQNSKSVYELISLVQSDLSKEGISKSQTNKFDKYNFRGIDDVYNALSPLMAKHGLVCVPFVLSTPITKDKATKSGGSDFLTTIEVEYRLYAPNGQMVVAKVFGEGSDRGDKSINKAMSSAYKNMAFQLFAIPTEGDHDTENHSPEYTQQPKQQSISKEQSDNFINQITDLQAQFLPQRKLSEVGKEFIGFINFKHGLQIQSSKEIPASLFEEINSNIENLFKEAFGI